MLSLMSSVGIDDGSLMLPSALSVHDLTSISMYLRHLPTCTTSGTLLPTGAFSSLNVPSTAVVVLTTAPLGKSAPQLHACEPMGTPLGSATRGFWGTKTT